MCTYLKDSTLYVAEEDIKCYKVVDLTDVGNYKSAYFNHYYEKGKEYTVNLIAPIKEMSFFTGGEAINCVNLGFHSFKKIEDAEAEHINLSEANIVECVIPKGSCYYKGFENYSEFNKEKGCYEVKFSIPSYVSEKIILNDVVPWKYPFKKNDKCTLEYVDMNGQDRKIEGFVVHAVPKNNHQVRLLFHYSQIEDFLFETDYDGNVLEDITHETCYIKKREYKVIPTLTKIGEEEICV